MTYRLAILMVLASLTGCAHEPTVAIPEGKHTVNFDRTLLADCQDLEKLKGPTDNEIKDNYEAVLKAYSECRTLKSKEDAEVKKAFQIRD